MKIKKLAAWLLALLMVVGTIPVSLAISPDHTHHWELKETIRKPTCTQNGLGIYYCAGCGFNERRSIPKTDHRWSDWVVTREPTPEMYGLEMRRCKLCGTEERRRINYDASAAQGEASIELMAAKMFYTAHLGYYEDENDDSNAYVSVEIHVDGAWYTPPEGVQFHVEVYAADGTLVQTIDRVSDGGEDADTFDVHIDVPGAYYAVVTASGEGVKPQTVTSNTITVNLSRFDFSDPVLSYSAGGYFVEGENVGNLECVLPCIWLDGNGDFQVADGYAYAREFMSFSLALHCVNEQGDRVVYTDDETPISLMETGALYQMQAEEAGDYYAVITVSDGMDSQILTSNTVTVEAPEGERRDLPIPYAPTEPADDDALYHPEITLDIASDDAQLKYVRVGDWVPVRATVTNTGEVPLAFLEFSGIETETGMNFSPALDVGQSETVVGWYEVQPEDMEIGHYTDPEDGTLTEEYHEESTLWLHGAVHYFYFATDSKGEPHVWETMDSASFAVHLTDVRSMLGDIRLNCEYEDRAYTAGEEISLLWSVTNVGPAVLHKLANDDNNETVPGLPDILNPGETYSWSETVVTTRQDYEDGLWVEGGADFTKDGKPEGRSFSVVAGNILTYFDPERPEGDNIACDDWFVVVELLPGEEEALPLEITSDYDGAAIHPNESAIVTFSVTNTTGSALKTGEIEGFAAYASTGLAAGETYSWTEEYPVTQGMIEEGHYIDPEDGSETEEYQKTCVAVRGGSVRYQKEGGGEAFGRCVLLLNLENSKGQPAQAPGAEEMTILPGALLEVLVSQTAGPTEPEAGDELIFQAEIINHYEVEINKINLVMTDKHMITLDNQTPAVKTLGPGETSAPFTFKYTVKKTDVNNLPFELKWEAIGELPAHYQTKYGNPMVVSEIVTKQFIPAPETPVTVEKPEEKPSGKPVEKPEEEVIPENIPDNLLILTVKQTGGPANPEVGDELQFEATIENPYDYSLNYTWINDMLEWDSFGGTGEIEAHETSAPIVFSYKLTADCFLSDPAQIPFIAFGDIFGHVILENADDVPYAIPDFVHSNVVEMPVNGEPDPGKPDDEIIPVVSEPEPDKGGEPIKMPKLSLSAVTLTEEPFTFDSDGNTPAVQYVLTVANIGDAPCSLSYVRVTVPDGYWDENLGDQTLAAGESVDVPVLNTFSQSDLDALDGMLHISFLAVANAQLKPLESNEVRLAHNARMPGDDEVPDEIPDITPGITLDRGGEKVDITIEFLPRSGHGAFYVENEILDVRVTWRSLTDQPLVHVYVEDQLAVLSGMTPDYLVTDGTLAPFQTDSVTFPYCVDNVDVVYQLVSDIASITAQNEQGDYAYDWDYCEDDAGKAFPLAKPGLTVVKEVISEYPNGKYYQKDDVIKYKITYTNTGNATLKNVKLFDCLNDSIVYSGFTIVSELKPGESRTFYYDYTVTEYDAEKVVNYALALYSVATIIDCPVASEPVTSLIGGDPDPVPKVDKGEKDSCVLTLTARGDGAEEYILTPCTHHAQVLAEANANPFKDSADPMTARTGWNRVRQLWETELDALYQRLFDAAVGGDARMAVMEDRAAFYAYVNAREAILAAGQPDRPDLAARHAAELIQRRATDLCYLVNNAPETPRPDSCLGHDYGELTVTAPAQCARRMEAREKGEYAITCLLCADHAAKIAGQLNDKDFALNQRLYRDAVSAATTVWYKSADSALRPLILEGRRALEAHLTAKQTLLTLQYPDAADTVAELISQAWRDALIDLCAGQTSPAQP